MVREDLGWTYNEMGENFEWKQETEMDKHLTLLTIKTITIYAYCKTKRMLDSHTTSARSYFYEILPNYICFAKIYGALRIYKFCLSFFKREGQREL